METIFITGASGAIGPQLLAALARELPAARFAVLLRPQTEGGERISRLRRRVAELCQLDGAAACDLHERLVPVAGDIRQPAGGMTRALAARLAAETTAIVHAAADTRFRADEAKQWVTNVEGTRNVLNWGRNCNSLRRFVLVSTTCVAGIRTGEIPEEPIDTRPAFVNHYEHTKWEKIGRAHV